MKKDILIGSHVAMSAPKYFEGSVLEALSYNANALMIYTGAPQNTIRKDVETLKINEGKLLLEKNKIPSSNVIIHAPYIINLCSEKPETRSLAIEFLKKELIRSHAFGAKYLVLHPGSRLSQSLNIGINQIINGINECFHEVDNDVVICLETMSGKGSEVGRTFEEIAEIIKGINQKERIGVCLDTCHIHDAGYDLNNFDDILEKFENIIGFNYLKVIHLNDSKNEINTHKDRHENIGYGKIGFDNLLYVAHHNKLENIVKILETPYISDNENTKKSYPIYKEEIEMIKNKKFNSSLK